jgi:glycosyltransferase involved in cell wall biosynthesis
MAVGLPVISTNVGGLPFLIEDKTDGILVNPESPAEFVNAIENLISDNDVLKKVTGNARNKVEEFDWETVKEKWFRLINSVSKN